MSAASPLESDWNRRRLRVPREPGAILAIPSIREMPAVIASNRNLIATWNATCLGKQLCELRQLAREEAVNASWQYTNRLDADLGKCEPLTFRNNLPLVVSGHQPELFHPGVWAKNFLLHQLAVGAGGIGLNLIVDSDTLASTRIAVPVGSKEKPTLEQIPFDADASPNEQNLPSEERVIRDSSLFQSFGVRISNALACWPIDPLVRTIWPAATSMLSHKSLRISDALTAARRHAERLAGLKNLELPLSRLSESESFAWFVCHLLSNVRRLHATYNEVVEQYRQVNRVRSVSHPLPNLAVGRAFDQRNSATIADDWFEVPFWIWRTGDSERSRLFVKQTASDIFLSNGKEELGSLSLSAKVDPARSVSQLRDLMASGLKLRTRALTTTMFARLFLSDAFLHGLGGAKYDEMTDRLIARLFGVTPPAYLTVTATAHLPIPSWDTTSFEVSQKLHQLNDFKNNVERHIAASSWTDADRREAESLMIEKRQLIAEQVEQDSLSATDPRHKLKRDNLQRCRRMRLINQRLVQLAESTRFQMATNLQKAQAQLAANEILRSRELSFCLFPCDVLVRFFESHFRSV